MRLVSLPFARRGDDGNRHGEGRAGQSPLTLKAGVALLALFTVVALTWSFLAPHDPYATSLTAPFAGPSRQHLLGTDVLGRDVLSRVLAGSWFVLVVSLGSTAVAVSVGTLMGLWSGLRGGLADRVVMATCEVLISVPLLILALLAIAVAGPDHSGSRLLLVGVVVLVYAPRTTRIVRAASRDLATREFVQAARLRGEGTWSIALREMLPNAVGVILVELGVRGGYAPILIGSLGFLGFGLQPPTPEWGLMISENRPSLAFAPWSVLAPTGALAMLVISLNLVTDGASRRLGQAEVREP